ncbi:hypothetical protein [Demequina sp.]|uniref:hypothetical protein n=1 Tax=Demequina sp. TaxID=2050685 RepID=UPI003D1346E1
MNDPTPADGRGRDAFESLVTHLGVPQRQILKSGAAGRDDLEYANPFDLEELATGEIHPVFAFVHHFRAHDLGNGGYTFNPYRGDHLSIPCNVDWSELAVIDVSFHKGQTFIEWVTFAVPSDEPTKALYGAAVELLRRYETR